MTTLAHGFESLVSEEMLERFWPKVQKTKSCWLWTASTRAGGYGQFYVGKLDGRYIVRAAHRVSWVIANGEPTPGMVIDHLCRNTLCVNPAHLEQVTNRENIIRSPFMAPGKRRRRSPIITHCYRGHPRTEFGVARGKRIQCIECERITARARRAKRGSA